jgi:hypothetical protein
VPSGLNSLIECVFAEVGEAGWNLTAPRSKLEIVREPHGLFRPTGPAGYRVVS